MWKGVNVVDEDRIPRARDDGLGDCVAPARRGHRRDRVEPDRTESPAARRPGASLAASPAEASFGAEVVITMLADPAALDQVLFGSEGLAPALHPGQTLIDMSTVGPDAVAGAL